MFSDKLAIKASIKFTFDDGSSSDSVLLEDLHNKEIVALTYLLSAEISDSNRIPIRCHCDDDNNCSDCLGTAIKEYKHRVKTVNGEWD